MTYIPRSSSSIPDPAGGSIPTHVRKKRTFRVFHILASSLFALSIISAVGVYLLGQYTDRKLDEARIALEQASNSNDRERVEAVGTFDERLETAALLLDQHMSPLRVFQRFEEITKDTVQLTKFAYDYEPGFEATLEFAVNTATLSSVALQRLDLAASAIFSDFVMRDIAMGSEGESGEGSQQDASEVSAQFAGILDSAQFVYLPDSAVQETETETIETPETVDPADAAETATSTEEITE